MEKVTQLIEDTRSKASDLVGSAATARHAHYHHVPGEAVPLEASQQYHRVLDGVRAQLASLRAETDRALTAIGFKSHASQQTVSEQLASGWHQVDSYLGLESKTDATLKSMGLRDKSAVDKARDAYDNAVHKIKVGLHLEEPTTAEKVIAGLPHIFATLI
jgi:hypothetical protein